MLASTDDAEWDDGIREKSGNAAAANGAGESWIGDVNEVVTDGRGKRRTERPMSVCEERLGAQAGRTAGANQRCEAGRGYWWRHGEEATGRGMTRGGDRAERMRGELIGGARGMAGDAGGLAAIFINAAVDSRGVRSFGA